MYSPEQLRAPDKALKAAFVANCRALLAADLVRLWIGDNTELSIFECREGRSHLVSFCETTINDYGQQTKIWKEIGVDTSGNIHKHVEASLGKLNSPVHLGMSDEVADYAEKIDILEAADISLAEHLDEVLEPEDLTAAAAFERVSFQELAECVALTDSLLQKHLPR
ncbi:MAG: hypothetical protein QFB87_03895 [Patescibacteria group bacterium]|nr:hypothetical protein [Patescibacteria group bacterium]